MYKTRWLVKKVTSALLRKEDQRTSWSRSVWICYRWLL